MRQDLLHRWRQDRLPLLLFLLTFVIMSHPFVLRMRDSLPIYNTDTFEILAKNWSLRETLINGKALDHSELLFYPNGIDITLQPQRFTSFPLWTGLYSIFGDPLAYNLVSLFGTLFKAYGMYLLGVYLYRARIPAWVCGAFYAFSAPVLAMTLRNPDTGATEWIPWFILVLTYGLNRLHSVNETGKTKTLMILAGLLFSLNVYMHLRIAIFAMLLGAGVITWKAIADRLLATRQFWLAVAVFALTAASTSAPLLIRTLSSDMYDFAIERPVRTDAGGAVDLLNFIKADHEWPLNARQSIAALSGEQLEIDSLSRGLSHIGTVAIVFALMGAAYILRFQRKEAVWIVLTILALLLSLGVIFHVDGQPLNIYWTPYRLLQDNFFFRALWHPFRMVIVFMFPFSILVGFGLYSRLRAVVLNWRESAMLVASVVVLLYGTSIFPIEMTASPRPGYLSALDALPEGAVIDLPMGRRPSKYYMAMQRFHGRPMVEGMLPRTPPHAYDYIRANPVLANLRYSDGTANLTENQWREAVSALLRDGFRYVILHRRVPLKMTDYSWLEDSIAELFISSTPVYKYHYESIYDLKSWKSPPPPPRASVGKDGYKALPDGDRVGLRFGENFIMHTWFRLDSVDVARCEWLSVESWWELSKAASVPHQITLVVSEEDGDGQIAIGEKTPASVDTREWRNGVYYRDRTEVFVPCDIEAGAYLLLLGMKESYSGISLPISSADGSSLGTLYYLTTFHVPQG